MSNAYFKRIPPKDSLIYREIRLFSIKTEQKAFESNYQDQAKLKQLFFESKILEESDKYFVLGCYSIDSTQLHGICAANIEDEVIELLQFYLKPEFRGMGLAGKLTESAIEIGKSLRTLSSAKLQVHKSNSVAIAAYKKVRFIPKMNEESNIIDMYKKI